MALNPNVVLISLVMVLVVSFFIELIFQPYSYDVFVTEFHDGKAYDKWSFNTRAKPEIVALCAVGFVFLNLMFFSMRGCANFFTSFFLPFYIVTSILLLIGCFSDYLINEIGTISAFLAGTTILVMSVATYFYFHFAATDEIVEPPRLDQYEELAGLYRTAAVYHRRFRNDIPRQPSQSPTRPRPSQQPPSPFRYYPSRFSPRELHHGDAISRAWQGFVRRQPASAVEIHPEDVVPGVDEANIIGEVEASASDMERSSVSGESELRTGDDDADEGRPRLERASGEEAGARRRRGRGRGKAGKGKKPQESGRRRK